MGVGKTQNKTKPQPYGCYFFFKVTFMGAKFVKKSFKRLFLTTFRLSVLTFVENVKHSPLWVQKCAKWYPLKWVLLGPANDYIIVKLLYCWTGSLLFENIQHVLILCRILWPASLKVYFSNQIIRTKILAFSFPHSCLLGEACDSDLRRGCLKLIVGKQRKK